MISFFQSSFDAIIFIAFCLPPQFIIQAHLLLSSSLHWAQYYVVHVSSSCHLAYLCMVFDCSCIVYSIQPPTKCLYPQFYFAFASLLSWCSLYHPHLFFYHSPPPVPYCPYFDNSSHCFFHPLWHSHPCLCCRDIVATELLWLRDSLIIWMSGLVGKSIQCLNWFFTVHKAVYEALLSLLLSGGGQSISVWRQVVELSLRWSACWKKEDNCDCCCEGKGGATEGRDNGGLVRWVVCPDWVVDWTMTLWTVMLLLQGVPDHMALVGIPSIVAWALMSSILPRNAWWPCCMIGRKRWQWCSQVPWDVALTPSSVPMTYCCWKGCMLLGPCGIMDSLLPSLLLLLTWNSQDNQPSLCCPPLNLADCNVMFCAPPVLTGAVATGVSLLSRWTVTGVDSGSGWSSQRRWWQHGGRQSAMRQQPAKVATADAGGQRYQWCHWSFTVSAASAHALGRLRVALEGVGGQQEEHNHDTTNTEPM